MAKKGQALQLQTEVNNDEDWEKLLQRDGLIIVDVYSEWCGPCSGMMATLKKLKLEIGGDVLQLAIAKTDKIAALERFRNKSEPTWMFISNGKMVNFMFGANAPKLTRLIIDELKKENEAIQGRRERVQYEISDLAEEEKERLEVLENLERKAKEKEHAKAAKELYDRRTAECQNILENLNHLGVIIIFPRARTAYQEAFGDLFGEAGLTICQTEKVDINEQQLDELFYFGENPFTNGATEELLNNTSIILQIKPIPSRDVEEPTDDLIFEILYGASKKPPGSPDSPARKLAKIPLHEEEEETEKVHESMAIWAPENELVKATALRIFFHRVTEHCLIAPPEPTPPHFAVIFEAIRRHEIADVMEKYPDEVLRYGFFTSEVPAKATLVAKTIKKYEKSPDRTPDEKMVIQLSKKMSECVLAFAQLKPLYISANVKEGKNDCQIFFPDDYDEPPEEEEEEKEAEEISKKPPKSPTESAVVTEGEETEEVVVPEEGVAPEGVVAPEGEGVVAPEGVLVPEEVVVPEELVVPEEVRVEGSEAVGEGEPVASTEGEVPATEVVEIAAEEKVETEDAPVEAETAKEESPA